MSQSEDEAGDTDPTVKVEHVKIDAVVREIFDGIFDGPMEQFRTPLQVIKENQCGLVWRDKNERNDKVMKHANVFLYAVTTSFTSKHAEAANHIDGSTCDLFLEYVYEKLECSLLSQDLFENSYREIKDSIGQKISRIRDKLEAKHDEHHAKKSDLEVMISETKLQDPIHIHHALLCCQVVRNCKNPENRKNSLDNLEKDHLLSEVFVSYENEYVPKYVMARCGDVLYVSFEGVQPHNFFTTEISYRGEISVGVFEAAKKIPLRYFAREIIQNKRIVFSGHSNGGAVASLVFLFLLEKFKYQSKEFLIKHFKCITFGLMPFANNMFKHYIEAIPGLYDCICHIVHKNDIVPKLFGSLNMTSLKSKLWELVENILRPACELTSKVPHPVSKKAKDILQFILLKGKSFINTMGFVVGCDQLDIFGNYFIIDTSKKGQKYSIKPAEEAAESLRICNSEGLREIRSQYLTYHQLERYAHEVEIAFLQELPDLTAFKSTCGKSDDRADDITPKIAGVQFENIGEQVVAKINGSNMWFVYKVCIEGIDCGGDNLKVDVMKSSECEVQTRMEKTHISYDGEVQIRVNTHFHNPKHAEGIKVSAKSTELEVTRRQQQLAKHSPRDIIELAYLSALLERHQEGYQSKRFTAIKTFFESAVLVVPLESIFHAVAYAKPNVVLQCCELLLSSDSLPVRSSKLLLDSMKSALPRIAFLQYCIASNGSLLYQFVEAPADVMLRKRDMRDMLELMQEENTKCDEWYQLLNNTYSCIHQLVLSSEGRTRRRRRQHLPCNIDLEIVYPAADGNNTCKKNKVKKCCKLPMTLLTEGRKNLNQLSEDLVAEQSQDLPKESTFSSTNIKMLSALTDLRKDFETCSTLLGAFMESQVHIPLDIVGDDKYVTKFAKHASSIGLSVWALLILPFKCLNRGTFSNFSEDFRKFVVEFSHHIHDIRNPTLYSEYQFPGYDERLEFLLASMKQSWACNHGYVTYSLERHLQKECKKRHIYHNTSLDEILGQWNANFENETLTLVPTEYRYLVARWIKWSLMINELRESLASQTAVGVIGLVNSGKSKFVRSLFGEKTVTGTTDQKRTTVPLIYNLGQNIEGMDVIDFPGVDDRDESIPQLAELLLSLTRMVVFVVDYRRAHAESTKEWLSNLERENVPVLVCLNFADELFGELMKENAGHDLQEVKLKIDKELSKIESKIGQPETGHQRDFKFTVFAFGHYSNLNTDENKEKMRKVGLKDELDVGRWIAEKLHCEQNEVSQNVIKFIEEKENDSTLGSSRRTKVPASESVTNNRDAPARKKKRADVEGISG